jgi:RNA polymerase sigma factor (sigma-70 family)
MSTPTVIAPRITAGNEPPDGSLEEVAVNVPIPGTLDDSHPAKNGDRINDWFDRRADCPAEFYTELQNYIKAIVNNRTRGNSRQFNDEDLDDLIQEACLKVHRNLDSFKSQSKFSTWVYTLTTNVFLDATRRISRRNETHLVGSDGDESVEPRRFASSHTFLETEPQLSLRLAFQNIEARLPAEDRQILTGWLNGETAFETAERLGLKVKRVNYRREIIKAQLSILKTSPKSSRIPQATGAMTSISSPSITSLGNRDQLERLSAGASSVLHKPESKNLASQGQIGKRDTSSVLVVKQMWLRMTYRLSIECEMEIGNSDELQRHSSERSN